jgi:hypothetical protein
MMGVLRLSQSRLFPSACSALSRAHTQKTTARSPRATRFARFRQRPHVPTADSFYHLSGADEQGLLSSVLDAVLSRGGEVAVALRERPHNDVMLRKLHDLRHRHGTAIKFAVEPAFHEKGC